VNPPLVGQSTNPNSAGVLGEGVTPDVADAGTGVYGRDRAGKGNGVIGYSETGRGVWGHSNTGFGVLGESVGGRGVVGTSQTDYGIRAHSNTLSGIRSSSDSGAGVEGEALGAGTGVVGTSVNGIGVSGKGGRLAGLFEGAVEVTGDIRLANVEVTGDIRLTNADCAEDFDVGATTAAEPGTVMVIGADGQLRPSERAYDKRVAGVISGAGNYQPGIVLDKQESRQRRLPIALLGKVFCKVDAQFGAIAVGDLLTTSSTPGHAMRADDPMTAFGAVLGKALRPLTEGQGLIPILIALQ